MGAVLRSFMQLPAKKRRAVELKHIGRTHREIAETISAEFGKKCSLSAVDHWFMNGNELQFALAEYGEDMANESLKQAKNLIRVFAAEGIVTLRELAQPGHKENTRVRAAQALASPLIAAIARDLPDAASNETMKVSKELQAIIDDEMKTISAGVRARQLESEAAHV